MPSIKTLSLGLTLATGVAGVGGAIAYSKGMFNSNKTQTKISELLDKENKYSLLPSESAQYETEWDAAWAKYREDSENSINDKNKWNIDGEEGLSIDKAPQQFKNTCQQKSSEKVNDKDDPKYKDIVNYCSRAKTLSEVFEKEGLTLLDTTNKEQEWKAKFETYKRSNNQIPEVELATSSDAEDKFTKLREGCKTSLARKTTDSNYQKTYDAIKEWCRP